MPTRTFQIIFYLVIGFCILTIVTAFISFDFIEVDTASKWTMKYFALPILVIMTPTCYFIYVRFLKQHERKEYKSRVWTQLRTFFRTLIMTLAVTAIFFATTVSMIVLTNAYIGNSRTINLQGKIVDYYTLKSNGRTRCYIKIQDRQFDRIIDLKVDRPYQIGEPFYKTMQIGYWGLLYSKK